MARTLYTSAGLAKLAEIMEQARGGLSYREFEAVVGISHATIRRIEKGDVKEPEIATLKKLAPHTPYILTELIAICRGTPNEETEVRQYLVAEDVLPYVRELSDLEAARLAQIILARLVRMEPMERGVSPSNHSSGCPTSRANI